MAAMKEYLWLVVVGALGAFGFGWGTGANDVANAFGTSIGSKALTLKQATIIAAVFEFVGALVLGRVSTNTIAGGIADVTSFAREPEVYAYGMSCALWVGTIWLIITSTLGLNVSSTHSIIGGIIGFALVYDGSNGIKWAERDANSFPPYKGVLPIIFSWFLAPFLTGAASALFFFLLRSFVLRRRNAFKLSFWVLPPLVFVVTWINMYFVFTKGAKKYIQSENNSWKDSTSAWVAAAIAAGMFLATAVIVVPLLQRAVGNRIEQERKEAELKSKDPEETTLGAAAGGEMIEMEDGAGKGGGSLVAPADAAAAQQPVSAFKRMSGWATHGLNVDVHRVVDKDPVVHKIHESAEKFDPHVEYVFAYLQVFSAICVIFAHGAGEVGYMAGPLATIWDVYSTGKLSKSVKPQIWIILIGAVGLVIGLATYGYNVTRAMGVKLAKLSPTRGMCAELATAFVIMIGAQYTLPTSSSQCITGAIVGIGIMEGLGGVNWKVFLEQFASWVVTLFFIGLCTALVFSQGVYSPSVISGKAVIQYENGITATSKAMLTNFNTTLQGYRAAANVSDLIPLLPNSASWNDLNSTVNKIPIINLDKAQTSYVDDVMKQLYSTLALVQNYSVDALGQIRVYPGASICNNNSTDLTTNNTVNCKPPFLVKS